MDDMAMFADGASSRWTFSEMRGISETLPTGAHHREELDHVCMFINEATHFPRLWCALLQDRDMNRWSGPSTFGSLSRRTLKLKLRRTAYPLNLSSNGDGRSKAVESGSLAWQTLESTVYELKLARSLDFIGLWHRCSCWDLAILKIQVF